MAIDQRLQLVVVWLGLHLGQRLLELLEGDVPVPVFVKVAERVLKVLLEVGVLELQATQCNGRERC